MIDTSSQIFLWIVPLICLILFGIGFWMAGGERRGISSLLIHFNILFLIPSILGDLISVFFVSIPLLVIYYYLMYRFADIIVPSADPYDKKEPWMQFWVFFWYSWGAQYPIWVVTDNVGSHFEKRVSGNFFKLFGAPGMICADSHHLIVITNNFEMTRLAGPGIAFTNRYERPYKIIDLRTQVRIREIQVITKDAVQFNALLAVPFSVDRENWTQEQYNRLYNSNTNLEGAMQLDRTIGVYPFSSIRVQEVFAFETANSPVDMESSANKLGEAVLDKVEPIARRVLQQRTLNEMWNPRNSAENSYALGEISDEIFSKADNLLRKHGVRLYATRIVGFWFEDKEIPKRLLEDWSIHLKNESRKLIEEANSKANLAKEKIRAEMTQARFEILKKSETRDPEVARKLAAFRTVTALENLDMGSVNRPVSSGQDAKDKNTPQKDLELDLRIKKHIKEIIFNEVLPEILRQTKSSLADDGEEK